MKEGFRNLNYRLANWLTAAFSAVFVLFHRLLVAPAILLPSLLLAQYSHGVATSMASAAVPTVLMTCCNPHKLFYHSSRISCPSQANVPRQLVSMQAAGTARLPLKRIENCYGHVWLLLDTCAGFCHEHNLWSRREV